MHSVSPVISEELIPAERVIALDQPQYQPIIVICAEHPEDKNHETHCTIVRFRLTEAERLQVANGADLILSELTFGRAFTPVHIEFCLPQETPSFVEKI